MKGKGPILGAHMSIAGGYYKAVEAAAALQMDCAQLFTKNNNQWRAKTIERDDVALFQQALQQAPGVSHLLAHNSYLINLAAPDESAWRQSLESMTMEVRRCGQLGVPAIVTHPGAYTSSSEEAGLRRIVAALDEILDQTRNEPVLILLENTAGQGSNLGWRFEHLAAILEQAKTPQRLGVCIDTCHLLAAGYPLGTQEEYEATFDELDRRVGLDRVRAFHVNDSKKPLGSRVDRHEHIGEGYLGLAPFHRLLNDPRFVNVPMYLETAKGLRDGVDLDAINLATLRGLVGRPPPEMASATDAAATFTASTPGKKTARKKASSKQAPSPAAAASAPPSGQPQSARKPVKKRRKPADESIKKPARKASPKD